MLSGITGSVAPRGVLEKRDSYNVLAAPLKMGDDPRTHQGSDTQDDRRAHGLLAIIAASRPASVTDGSLDTEGGGTSPLGTVEKYGITI